MKRILVFLLVIVTLAGAAPSLFAQVVTEASGANGSVDWSDQVVRAKGIAVHGGVGGRAGQIRAAELDALRQILETVKGMRISSETTVENFMLSSDVIRTRIEGIARNFKLVGDPVYMSDGSIEVTVEMKLTGPGQLYDAVLPTQMGGATPLYPQPVSGGNVYSGLIIDARDLGVRPAIAPRVFADNGDVIYGDKVVDRDWAIKQGMVGYAKSVDAARATGRVGDNPMIVRALRASGPNRTDVVISNKDAQILQGISENFKFLQQCRVVFLVD